jgi:hypothetical protein
VGSGLATAIRSELKRCPGFVLVQEKPGIMYVAANHHRGNVTVKEMDDRLSTLSDLLARWEHKIVSFGRNQDRSITIGRLVFDGVTIWLYPSDFLARKGKDHFPRNVWRAKS